MNLAVGQGIVFVIIVARTNLFQFLNIRFGASESRENGVTVNRCCPTFTPHMLVFKDERVIWRKERFADCESHIILDERLFVPPFRSVCIAPVRIVMVPLENDTTGSVGCLAFQTMLLVSEQSIPLATQNTNNEMTHAVDYS